MFCWMLPVDMRFQLSLLVRCVVTKGTEVLLVFVLISYMLVQTSDIVCCKVASFTLNLSYLTIVIVDCRL